MEKSFEKNYSAAEKESDEKDAGVEISKENWQTLEIIARRVGGDFGMKVKKGPLYLEEFNPLTAKKEKIPYIVFENPEDRSITFNPLFVKENPRKAKRIAAHEGAHRAITRGNHEIGLSNEQIQRMQTSEYLGFHSFNNIGLEDPRVNNWDTGKFPGLVELNQEVYGEQLREENAQFIAPEVNLIISKLGRYPRYAEAASELLRFWHKGNYSKELKPEIQKFLQRTQKSATEYQTTIPPTGRSLKELEVIEKSQKCFEEYHNYIWPEVKKLVEMDLRTEEQRQMLNDSDLFNQLPEDAREELKKQIDKAMKEITEELNKQIKEKQSQAEEAKRGQEELDKGIKDLEEKAKSASGKEKEELEKQIKQKRDEKLAQEIKQKQAEQDSKQTEDALRDIQSGGGEMPYPEDKLFDKTKEEIEKLFKNLPSSKQKDLRQKAEKQLEDFEDAINKEMEGKLNEDKPESHKEKRKGEEQEKIILEERKQTDEARKELEKKLEQARQEKMTEYDKTYEEVADIVNSLYNRLKKFFLPERHPKWQKGYPTGSRLDLEKAMQAEADPHYLEKIWQRKTIPHKFDYRFSVLIDLSGSMRGEKIEETFKGLVVLAEVLEKLGMQYEIVGFSSEVETFKEWKDKLNKRKRNELVEFKNWGGQNTHTDEATELALEHILKNKGKDNFILTLTDGQPYPSGHGERLQEILRELKNKKIKTVGVGLGQDAEFVKNYYRASLFLPNVKPTEQQKKEGQKDFAEAFADLLEDMIRHPEKY